jgi:ATP phosphoribosyltransferase
MNKDSYKNEKKRDKIKNIAMLLKAAIESETKVGLLCNVKNQDLDEVLKILPSMKSPTVNSLADKEWNAVSTIIEESKARDIIIALKQVGAADIIEFPLNKVIP